MSTRRLQHTAFRLSPLALRVAPMVASAVLALAPMALAVGAAPAHAQTGPSGAPASAIPSAIPGAPPAQAAAPAKAPAEASALTATQCNLPKQAPHIPDGRTASDADMRKAHDELKLYVDLGQAFIGCVDDVVAAHRHEVTVAAYLGDTALQDAVTNNMQILAAVFNNQLHIFRARNGAAAPAQPAAPAGK